MARATLADLSGDKDFLAALESWDDTEEPSSFLMDEMSNWAVVVAHRAPDGPEKDALWEASDYWESLDEHDLDAANDLVAGIRSALAAAGV